MTELERSKALKEVQLELFQLTRTFAQIASLYHAQRKRFVQAKAALLRKEVQLKNRGTKECRKCREVMAVEQFYIDKRYRDERYPWCIECKNEANKSRYHRRKLAA